MSEYKFTIDADLPATRGFGPGVRVIFRETGDLLGWVRRVDVDYPSWHLYGSDGDLVGEADQRTTAANWLLREFHKSP